MGGGGGGYDEPVYYAREVNRVQQTSNRGAVAVSVAAENAIGGSFRTPMDPRASPKEGGRPKRLTCNASSPVVVAVDMTGSMGDWPKVIYDKLPMFFGQIMMQGYLVDPSIGFCGIGDTLTASAEREGHAYKPVAVTEFAAGAVIDEELKKLSKTSGNGPIPAYEPYGLMAYYYANFVDFPEATQKPILFITADEFFYEEVDSEQLQKCFGVRAPSISTVEVFQQLRSKYEVFLIKKRYDVGGYDKARDDRIVAEWEKLISAERILKLDEPNAVIDIMLGAISIVSGTRDLDAYGTDMQNRGQDAHRQAVVNAALGGFALTEAQMLAEELAAAKAELAALKEEEVHAMVHTLSGDLQSVKGQSQAEANRAAARR